MISLKDFLILTKFTLSFTVSLSCFFAYVLFKNSLDLDLIIPFIAVLLLALGVSSLNQIQEYKEDALMPRTQNRPVAAKRVTVKKALFITFLLIGAAFIAIYVSMQSLGLFIFSGVILLYNVFYTKAKKRTAYAAVYGAVLGVIPPLIGWISAGGDLTDIRFLALGLFYFIWQIPHFWLLTLKYYKDYKRANFPTVIDIFGVQGVERVTFIWLLLTVIAGMFLVLTFSNIPFWIMSLIIVLNLYTVYSIMSLITKHKYLYNFMVINLYMILTMTLLIVGSFLKISF